MGRGEGGDDGVFSACRAPKNPLDALGKAEVTGAGQLLRPVPGVERGQRGCILWAVLKEVEPSC